MKLQRFSGNPILSPETKNAWESAVATNPGAWYDEQNDEVILLYRAAGDDPAHVIHFGLATSRDGYHFTRVSDKPVLSPSVDGFDAGCVEDPRIVKMGDWYYVTYAVRTFPPGQYWLPVAEQAYQREAAPADFPWILRENATATGLALTKDFKHWIRAGRITDPLLDDRDVMIFPEKIHGQYAMIHRPASWIGEEYGTDNPAMWIAFSDDLLSWKSSRLLAKAHFPWEGKKVGGSTPPIRTREGWLLLYHAVGVDQYYRIGAMLLDLDDPTIIRCRTYDSIFEPEKDYETKGYYNGVVFPCGAIVKNDTLMMYYGGADKYVGIATCKLDELVQYLLACPV